MKSALRKLKSSILLPVLCAALLYSSLAHASLNWYEDLNRAQEYARTHDKYILIHFTGSDWCPWCIKLDKNVLSTQEFADFAQEQLVLVKVDFPKRIHQSQEQANKNRELAQKYWVRGFPTIIILDRDGEEVARTGFQRGSAQNYIEHLKESME